MRKILIALLVTIGLNSFAQSKAPSHDLWTELLKKNVTAEGKVNYKGFITDSVKLNKYLKILSASKPDEKTWSVNELKTFWINAYNSFTVKLIVINYPVKSIKDVGAKMQIPFVNTPWDIKFIKIGGETYDLNNIEHANLRRKFGDARVHFALVCASKSCPFLLNEAYTANKLDQQLDAQAKVFLCDKTRNNITSTNPKLSKIFDWYADDFKSGNTKVIDYINKYATVKITPKASITYLEYSWDLNE